MPAESVDAPVSSDEVDSLVAAAEADQLELDGVRFTSALFGEPWTPGSTVVIRKDPPATMDAIRRFSELRPERVVEVGIFEGASTAFFAELMARFSGGGTLLAVDLGHDFDVLHEHLASRRLPVEVEVRTGVDQSDRRALDWHCVDVFGDEALDLVVDDASHEYGPSRTTFEALFPRLRPGGSYLLEDWQEMMGLGEALVRALSAVDGAPPLDSELEALLRAYARRTLGVRDMHVPLRRLFPSFPTVARIEDLAHLVAHQLVDRFRHRTAIGAFLEEQLRVSPARGIDELAAEILHLASASAGAVRAIAMGHGWLEVVRGPATFDEDAFTATFAASLVGRY